ncbi:MAG: helix-hairpin-helix protein [Paucimonas sp.]|nr:helix-hairpin-helix protein [Paucimonas sp.]
MNRFVKAALLAASLMFMTTGAMAAKDDAKPGADKAAASAATGNKASSKSDSAAADKGKSGATLDLNTASEADLMTLPQIGDARAKAIVAGRPYARKDELVSKKIVTQKVYDGIKDKIVAKGGAGEKSGASGASASAKGDSSGAMGAKAGSKSEAASATGNKASSKTEPAASDKKK